MQLNMFMCISSLQEYSAKVHNFTCGFRFLWLQNTCDLKCIPSEQNTDVYVSITTMPSQHWICFLFIACCYASLLFTMCLDAVAVRACALPTIEGSIISPWRPAKVWRGPRPASVCGIIVPLQWLTGALSHYHHKAIWPQQVASNTVSAGCKRRKLVVLLTLD